MFFLGPLIPVNNSVNQPLFQHSYGLTENYAIITEVPCTYGYGLDWSKFEWIPGMPVTWYIIDRNTKEKVFHVKSEPFFTFHHVNSYENKTDQTLVVDLITYPNNSVIDVLYLNVLINEPSLTNAATHGAILHRYIIPLNSSNGDQIHGTPISSTCIELPTINWSKLTQYYTYTYGMSLSSNTSDYFDQLVKTNVQTGEVIAWVAPSGCYVGEPIFIPDPSRLDQEDGGIITSVVLDTIAQNSFLSILDASDLSEIARAYAPTFIPFGFHGYYQPFDYN